MGLVSRKSYLLPSLLLSIFMLTHAFAGLNTTSVGMNTENEVLHASLFNTTLDFHIASLIIYIFVLIIPLWFPLI